MKPTIQKLLSKQMTRKEFLIFGALMVAAATGILALVRRIGISGATTTTAAVEPETATLNGGAVVKTDTTASGSQAVQFGATLPPSNFTEFAPGSVKPLGYADEAAGLGTRNVGPRVSTFTRHDGDYVLTPGAKVLGLEIFGRLTGRGDATTVVSDCIIHGSAAPSYSNSAATLGTSYNLGGVTIEWCRIDVVSNVGFTDVIAGGNYNLRYSELAGGVDGIGANITGNATVHCCRIWNGYYFSWWNDAANSVRTTSYVDADGITHNPPFPAQSSGDTHSDGIQFQQASGWVVRGNYIGGSRIPTVIANDLDPTIKADNDLMKQFNAGSEFVFSAVMITPIGKPSSGVTNKVGALIENNWFHGGSARLNVGWKPDDTLDGVTIRNNRFIRSNYGYYIYKHPSTAATFSNNIFDDTGAAVPVVNWP